MQAGRGSKISLFFKSPQPIFCKNSSIFYNQFVERGPIFFKPLGLLRFFSNEAGNTNTAPPKDLQSLLKSLYDKEYFTNFTESENEGEGVEGEQDGEDEETVPNTRPESFPPGKKNFEFKIGPKKLFGIFYQLC